MRVIRPLWSHRVGMAVAGLGGAAVLYSALPSRGQQEPPQPAVRLLAPAAAARAATTPVNVEFALPTGARLVRNPRLRVVNEKDELWELLPTFITRLPPAGLGARGLHTENYPVGTYRVRGEVEYVLPNGQRDTLVSPEVTVRVTTPPVEPPPGPVSRG